MKWNLVWMRRDLRLEDNAALYHALKTKKNVLPVFIFDTEILDNLSDKKDARITFIHNEVGRLKIDLQSMGSDILVKYGSPLEVWREIIESYDIDSVFINRDYERYAVKRDSMVEEFLNNHNVSLNSYKDHVIFEADEVLKDNGDPYVVFTPYKRRWLAKLETKSENGISYYFKTYPCKKYQSNYAKAEVSEMPSLSDMGFEKSDLELPSKEVPQGVIKAYDEQRDFPAVSGTSRLGIHFRFGTISIREKALKAQRLNEVFLSELVWRDFYSMILQKFPRVEDQSFREKYERIEWVNNEKEFQAWCDGKTGYPMVDAGMRELNQTGHMHNRVRMVVASFLTKHLLIDWRWGERYFAEKLLDFDLASNAGGWQWAAGCGTDAAPYFRIFNPESQMKKFDKDLIYIKKYVPEYGTDSYPDPIVDHRMARERCLSTYKRALT